MTKKKKSAKHVHPKPTTQIKTTSPSWHIPLILIVTFAAYVPTLSAGFVNWDDPDYVGSNILIRDISRLGELLTTPVQGNHHPITMISLAINYIISKDAAWSYHLLNIIFHLVNCYLVYKFIFSLSKNSFISFVTSLLFGIHPMHVESVAWVSERKDVLYTLFFLAGHITFTKFVETGIKKHYWLTLLFLILSLLSKPAAVIFPVSLFCIDIFRGRAINFKSILEKLIFFVPALVIGLITMNEQRKIGATGEEYFGLVQNILFGCYGIMMYFVKLILPFNQSAFYPFPPLNEKLSVAYYISPVFVLFLLAITWYSWKKNKAIAFGLSFYIINLLLVLQVFTVGSAVIAERYTYVPYIGLFFITGYLINVITKSNIQKSTSIIAPIGIFFLVLTFMQVQVWKNGATLWDSIIKNQPSSKAYSLRGALFRQEKEYRKAIEYFSKAISMNSIDHESHNNRANIYMDLNKFDSAFLDYKSSLAIKPDYYVTYDNLGALFARQNMFDSALRYLNRAIELKPDYKPAYSNRGLTLMSIERYPEAIKDWETFDRLQPNDPIVINTIGLCYLRMGRYTESLPYFNRAISMNPMAPFLLNRSYAHFYLNNIPQARSDAQAARQAGAEVPGPYLQQLGIQLKN